jgi:hypothetical protein
MQGRTVHVKCVSSAKTFKERKKLLLSWFSGTPYTETQQNRSDKMHRQPAPSVMGCITGVVIRLVQTYVWRLFGQAQLEETRYSAGSRGRGTA